MKCIKNVAVLILTLFVTQAYCQRITQDDTTGKVKTPKPYHRWLVSSPYHTFTNYIGPSVSMYEFHFGYRITPKDIIKIKAVTWSLFAPLGIPFGPDLMKKSENYPGRTREYGAGLCYQRMLWKGLFATVEVVPMRKLFLDPDGKKIDSGFRLYTSYHIGYEIPMFKNRMFIQPQIHCNYWPVDSKGPQGFKEKDEKWNNYFLFEPNIYIGVNF